VVLMVPSIKNTVKMCRIVVMANYVYKGNIRFCVMQFEIMGALLFFYVKLAVRDKQNEMLNSLPGFNLFWCQERSL
jgi:hypothetical protein